MNFNQVIIWGHKLHSHTHSYIHYGFYKAFKNLKYKVIWLDNKDDISGIDFKNSLFISEHQVDQNIPIRDDCKYILHNSFVDGGKAYYKKNAGTWSDKRYIHLAEKGNVINLQVYRPSFVKNKTKMDDYIYYDLKTTSLYMPWATDLLPFEIEENKKKIKDIQKEKVIYYIGTPEIDGLKRFAKTCKDNGIEFKTYGGFKNNVTSKKHVELIQKSYIAPAIQRKQQTNTGYIPCRIFKNISYGQPGITNSKVVYELFDKKIIYHPDVDKLFYIARDYLENDFDIQSLYDQMDFVKEKHTYLNRIKCLFDFFDIIKKEKMKL